MSEKRFIRNIVGDIYDSEKDKWFEEDWKGKSLDYDDDLIVFLNKQQATISQLEEENDNMNLFIKQTIEPLLLDCVFELNTIESMSQVELAEKIEDEIIPFIQDFKYLKYESLEEEKQDNI
jgi:hypothetical protein